MRQALTGDAGAWSGEYMISKCNDRFAKHNTGSVSSTIKVMQYDVVVMRCRIESLFHFKLLIMDLQYIISFKVLTMFVSLLLTLPFIARIYEW